MIDEKIKTFTENLTQIAISREASNFLTLTKSKLMQENANVILQDKTVVSAKDIEKARIEVTERYTLFFTTVIFCDWLYRILQDNTLKLFKTDKNKKVIKTILEHNIRIKPDGDINNNFLRLQIDWELFKYLGTLNIPALATSLRHELYLLDESNTDENGNPKKNAPFYTFYSEKSNMGIQVKVLSVLDKNIQENNRGAFITGKKGNHTIGVIDIRYLKAFTVRTDTKGKVIDSFFNIPIFFIPKCFLTLGAFYNETTLFLVKRKARNEMKKRNPNWQEMYQFYLIVQKHDNGKGDIYIDFKEIAPLFTPYYRYDKSSGNYLKRPLQEKIINKATSYVFFFKEMIKTRLIIAGNAIPIGILIDDRPTSQRQLIIGVWRGEPANKINLLQNGKKYGEIDLSYNEQHAKIIELYTQNI